MKALFIFPLLFGCVTPTLTPDERNKITAEITLTLNTYYTDILQYGLTAEFKYLDSTDAFFWIPPGFDSPISYDSVAAILRNSDAVFSSVENKWLTLQIFPEDLNNATYQGKIRSEMIDSSGTKRSMILEEKGRLIRRKNGWKLLSGETKLISGKE